MEQSNRVIIVFVQGTEKGSEKTAVIFFSWAWRAEAFTLQSNTIENRVDKRVFN